MYFAVVQTLGSAVLISFMNCCTNVNCRMTNTFSRVLLVNVYTFVIIYRISKMWLMTLCAKQIPVISTQSILSYMTENEVNAFATKNCVHLIGSWDAFDMVLCFAQNLIHKHVFDQRAVICLCWMPKSSKKRTSSTSFILQRFPKSLKLSQKLEHSLEVVQIERDKNRGESDRDRKRVREKISKTQSHKHHLKHIRHSSSTQKTYTLYLYTYIKYYSRNKAVIEIVPVV